MIYAPIIHSRTYNCDFNAQLAVRPSDYGNDDVKAIREYILAATSGIDFINGVRRVVFRHNEDVIAGMVGFLDELRGNDDSDEALCFARDVRQRKTFAFIGIVIRDMEKHPLPYISKNLLWKIFKDNMLEKWKSKTAFTISVDFNDYKGDSYSGGDSNAGFNGWKQAGDLYFTETLSDNQENILFHSMISKVAEHKSKSFCSNLDSKEAVKKNKFQYVTVSQSVIKSIESCVNKKNISSTSVAANHITPINRGVTYRGRSEKKKVLISMPLIGIILAIIIILLIVKWVL